jgi:glycosyltransferase involved in cell wall biosynthesis
MSITLPDEAPGMPATSLIICSRNRAELLLDTVGSVLAGDAIPEELVIVDQSSMYNSLLAELQDSKGCQIRYIWSHSIGLCKARNIGVAQSTHEVLAFIDDDMRVSPDWFGILIQTLVKAGPKGVVTGRVLPGSAEISGGFVPSSVTGDEHMVYSGRIGKDVLAAGHMAMFRSTIHATGNFDERLGAGAPFPAADDNDYGFRLLEAGFHIIYEPQAIVNHRAWRDQHEYFHLRWSYGCGKGGFYMKYFSLKDPYILKRMIKDTGIHILRFPWRVLHKPYLAVGDLYYASGIIIGSIKWLFSSMKNDFSSKEPSTTELNV